MSRILACSPSPNGSALLWEEKALITQLGSTFWDGRNEVFVRAFQELWNQANPDNQLTVDGKAGEQTFTALDPRAWPMRKLSDGREIFVTNDWVSGGHTGIDVFYTWVDGDELIEGYWTPFAGGKVWYPYGAIASAAAAGVVTENRLLESGWEVQITHANGDVSIYAHGRDQTSFVELDDQVELGQSLFYVGWSTRNAPLYPDEDHAVHVHFGVKRDGSFMDPELWLQYAIYLDACKQVCPDQLEAAA